MPAFRISVNGLLPGSVLQAALLSLLELRLRLRRQLRVVYPNESSMLAIKRLAKYESDWWKLEHWNYLTPAQRLAELRDSPDATMNALQSSAGYAQKLHASAKTKELCLLCWRMEHFFRLARSSESVIDMPDFDRIRDDENIPYFDPQKEKVDDFVRALNLDAEALLYLAFISGQSLGIIEGVQLQAKNVAAHGGAARARLKAAEVSEARAAIRQHIRKEIDRRRSEPSNQGRTKTRLPKLSGQLIATAMQYSDMSDLGHAKLASIAVQELKTFTT